MAKMLVVNNSVKTHGMCLQLKAHGLADCSTQNVLPTQILRDIYRYFNCLLPLLKTAYGWTFFVWKISTFCVSFYADLESK